MLGERRGLTDVRVALARLAATEGELERTEREARELERTEREARELKGGTST